MNRIAALGLVALTACFPGRSRTDSPRAAAPLGAPRVVAGELEAKGLLDDLPARLASAGAGPMSIVAAGEAYEGERLGAFVDVPADACLLAYARASKSVDDLDVAVFSDEGTPLAIDEAPDAHPTTMLCPPHPDRVYVAAHTASGEGLVAVAAQLVPKANAAAVGRVAGARGSTGEGPRPADSWPGLDEMVREHRKALGGAWEEIRKVALSVDARTPTLTALALGADECADAVVFPSEDVALLDVEVLDGDGRTIARARESGKARTVTLCSPLAINGSLAIRPHVGRGLAAVVIARARGEVARDLTARPEIAWVAPVEPNAPHLISASIAFLLTARPSTRSTRARSRRTDARASTCSAVRRSRMSTPRSGRTRGSSSAPTKGRAGRRSSRARTGCCGSISKRAGVQARSRCWSAPSGGAIRRSPRRLWQPHA